MIAFQIQHPSLTKEGREILLAEIVKHKKFVRDVRRSYYARQERAIDKPNQFISIIIGW